MRSVRYISTRGEAPPLDFVDVTPGRARPRRRPLRARVLAAARAGRRSPRFAGLPYAEVAVEVIRRSSAATIADADLARMCARGLRHASAIPPWRRWSSSAPNSFVLELFHGPTLAFKDLAMQLLARLMDHVLEQRGERATIVGRDLGRYRRRRRSRRSAAAPMSTSSCCFPKGRISDVQRRHDDHGRRTTMSMRWRSRAPSTTARRSVKAMFNDTPFRDELRPVGRQLDQLRPHRRPDRLLLHRRRRARRAAPQGRLHRADRQFRRRVRRLCRHRMGLPIERSGDRHQRQRHPGPHSSRPAATSCARCRRPPRRSMDIQVVVQLRAAAVRGLRPRCRGRSAPPWRRSPSRARFACRAPRAGATCARCSPPTAPTRTRRRPRSARPCARPAIWSIRTPRSRLPLPRSESPRSGDADDRRCRPRIRPSSPPRSSGVGRAARLPAGSAICISAGACHRARPRSGAGRALRARAAAAPRAKEPPHDRQGDPPPIRPVGHHRRHAASADRLARRVGRMRQPRRSGRRARHLAFSRAHGVQGHRAAQRARRSPRRSRRSAAISTPPPARDDRLLCPRAEGGRAARARRPVRHPDRAGVRSRRDHAREERHHPGDRRSRGHPDDLVFDHLQSTAFADQPVGRSILGTPATVRRSTASGCAPILRAITARPTR